MKFSNKNNSYVIKTKTEDKLQKTRKKNVTQFKYLGTIITNDDLLDTCKRQKNRNEVDKTRFCKFREGIENNGGVAVE